MATLVQADSETERLIAELYRVEGKAEIVDGRIVYLPMSGLTPGALALEIVVSLHAFARRTRTGRAFADGVDYLVDLPRRKSFKPDASYYTGPDTGMKFGEGSPVFAVEVRSENDYGRAAERDMAAKRADYFAADTLVVWDVDPLGTEGWVIRVFRDGDAETPAAVFRRGEVADAEPAVPGWTLAVDDLFAAA